MRATGLGDRRAYLTRRLADVEDRLARHGAARAAAGARRREIELLSLHTKVSDLDTIRLVKGSSGFAFERETSKPVTREALEEEFERDARHRAGPALRCEMSVPGRELPR